MAEVFKRFLCWIGRHDFGDGWFELCDEEHRRECERCDHSEHRVVYQ